MPERNEDRSVPLSAALDAAKEALQEQFDQAHGNDWSAADADRYAEDKALLDQRLAILDAERAATRADDAPDGHEHVTLRVHPEARDALRARLFEPDMRGVGYSEFILRAVAATRASTGATGEPRCQHGSWQGTYCPHCGGNRAVFGAQRGLPSLTDPRASTGAGLDVGLVRAAFTNMVVVRDAPVLNDEFWTAVGAEYARLAAAHPSREDSPVIDPPERETQP